MKIPREFYLREDVLQIAKDLLGKYLFTRINNQLTGGIITETEAYAGVNDRASHAYNGRRTTRTEIMYSIGGTAYVYLCYGVHPLFNVVTNAHDIPHAVLIRALHPTHGIDTMLKRKPHPKEKLNKLAPGPGSVSKVLGIDCSQTGISLLEKKIWLEDRGHQVPENKIITGPRIGCESAGKDGLLPYRYRVLNWEEFCK